MRKGKNEHMGNPFKVDTMMILFKRATGDRKDTVIYVALEIQAHVVGQ